MILLEVCHQNDVAFRWTLPGAVVLDVAFSWTWPGAAGLDGVPAGLLFRCSLPEASVLDVPCRRPLC